MAYTYETLQAKFFERSTRLNCVKECRNLIALQDKTNDNLVGRSRDLALLEWLAVNKYSDLFMIGLVTVNNHDNNVYKQLAALLKRKFIRKIRLAGTPLWRITKLGIQFLNQEAGTNYPTNIVTGSVSDGLFPHTMMVQVSLLKLLDRFGDEASYISEFHLASLLKWLYDQGEKLTKVPDLICYQDPEGMKIPTAFEIEVEDKKPWQVQKALYGMDQLLKAGIVHKAKYLFAQKSSVTFYEKYLLQSEDDEGNESYVEAYDYDRLGNITYTDGRKVVRELTEIRGAFELFRLHPRKNKDKEIIDLLECRRYLSGIKPVQNRHKQSKTSAFKTWEKNALEVFSDISDRDFELSADFISELVEGDFRYILSIPYKKRKLLSQLLLLVDADDYSDSRMIQISRYLKELESKPEPEPERKIIRTKQGFDLTRVR